MAAPKERHQIKIRAERAVLAAVHLPTSRFDARDPLVGLLERRRHDVNAIADRGALGDDAAMWMRHFSLEGVALLKIARHKIDL